MMRAVPTNLSGVKLRTASISFANGAPDDAAARRNCQLSSFDTELVGFWFFAIWLPEPHPTSDTTNRIRRTDTGFVTIAGFVASNPSCACRANRNQK